LLGCENLACGLLQSGTCLFQLGDYNNLQGAIDNLQLKTNRAQVGSQVVNHQLIGSLELEISYLHVFDHMLETRKSSRFKK